MLYFLAILTALLLSAFQYLYKRKALWLFIWRFLVYAIILILIINPKWKRTKQILIKPALYVLADNSLSIKLQNAGQSLRNFVDHIKQSDLDDKYEVRYFKFDKNLSPLDSLDFSGNQTAIGDALYEISFLHQNGQNAPLVLLTDGQNTSGRDYVYDNHLPGSIKIFPVVFGDTVEYQDLHIDLVNVNPYVYKDNFFTVEIFVSGKVDHSVQAHLKIQEKGKILFRKTLNLSPEQNSAHIVTKLKAGKVGLHRYQVSLSGLKNEKNYLNNRSFFSIEVLKNVQKILFLSNIIHPDIGAIKRSFKNHPYVRLELKKPTVPFNLADYQSVILYQPDSKFASVFDRLKKMHKTWWIITGKHTDWQFLNTQKLFFTKIPATTFEYYFPQKNNAFALFTLPELDLEKMPPLIDVYGQVKLSPADDIAYYSKINGIATKQPLLAFNTRQKQAVLLGENIWQWAMQSGINQQKESFDRLLFQIIQYLSIGDDFDRLQLQYKKQYYQDVPVVISAKFLDKNLESDTKVKPELILSNNNKTKIFPMFLKDDFFQAELSDLPPGTYSFTVKNKTGSLKKHGYFRVLPYSIEKENLQANIKNLNLLAGQKSGSLYFQEQADNLIKDLKNTKAFHSSIRYETSKTPFIDFKYLLFLIVLLLTVEWLVKKLRGEL